MKLRNYTHLIFVLAIIMTSCQKPYSPKITAGNVNYLVVEGVINSGQDSTIIKLSRTINVADTIKANPEFGAQVTIEGDQATVYPLSETGNGSYVSANLNLDNTHKYRLHIITVAGNEYRSDYEAVNITPPIDSVGYTVQSNGIQLYVNTHDPNNNTHYYRWDYQETWNFHARYAAAFITDGKELKYRTPDQQIYSCFGNDVSNNILLGSTKALSQDVVSQAPLTQILPTSEKLEAKYSILVNEYALSSEAYNFWQNLKKNTEKLGSIFDAQPSEVPGNIHCITNPLELVIGYVSVCTVQQKRIFISESQLPQTWKTVYPYNCGVDSLLYSNSGSQNDVALFLIPLGTTEFAIGTITDKFGTIIGYPSADAQCADCTIRGTTKQPLFWR